jgi:hypothetical protein
MSEQSSIFKFNTNVGQHILKNHDIANAFSVEFTADFWYLSVVSGAKRTPIKTSNDIANAIVAKAAIKPSDTVLEVGRRCQVKDRPQVLY